MPLNRSISLITYAALFLTAACQSGAPLGTEDRIRTAVVVRPTVTPRVPNLMECGAASLAFPLPADASACVALGASATFRTALAPADLQQFYADFFHRDGWRREGEPNPNALSVVWSKPPRKLSVTTFAEGALIAVNVTDLSEAATPAR